MRRFLPSLSALQAFEASAQHMNFTKAGEDLGLTQSAISRQIKTLEGYLGISLFERHGSRLVLTDHGRTYAQDIGCALDTLEEASIDAVRGRKFHTGLVVGSTATFAQCWLTPRIESYTAQHPDLPLELTQASNDMRFEETEVDVAILRGGGAWSGAISYHLFDEKICLIASPDLIPVGERLENKDFSSFPLLQNSARPSFWLQWVRAANVSHKGEIQGPRFAQTAMLVNAVRSGMGIGVVPTVLAERSLLNGEVHCPFGPPVFSGVSYYAVFAERKGHLSRIRVFRDWLLQETRYLRET